MTDNSYVKSFRRTPIALEAFRFTPLQQAELAEWCGGQVSVVPINGDDNSIELVIVLETDDGLTIANVGDYVIKGIAGDFYPCKSEIFHSLYEEIVDVS